MGAGADERASEGRAGVGQLTVQSSTEASTVPTAPAPAADETLVAGLTDLLVKAVRGLGAAGQPEQASRLSGKAWWLLKEYPRQAERINGTMHYLAKLEQANPAAQ